MDFCRKEAVIVKSQLIRWKKDVRIAVTLGTEAILIIQYLWPFTAYGLVNGTKITPCMLPFLFQGGTLGTNMSKVMIYLGIVIIFSDAPFMDDITPYSIIRSKRGAWWRGECLYIWTASFLYMLFLTIVSALVVLPTVTLTGLWGSTVVDAVYAGGIPNQGVNIPTKLIQIFYPSATLLLTFVTGWLSMVLLGNLAYVFNLFTNQKIPGIAVMVFFVMLDPIVNWLAFGPALLWWYRVSPVTWSTMRHWKLVGVDSPLSTGYIFLVYGILIILSMMGIALGSRKKQIDVNSLQ